jgi:hypothetical protein
MGSWDLLGNLADLGAKRIKLTFDNSQQATPLIDFPVLVVLDPVRTAGYGGFAAQGEDIRFVDPDSPAERLDYEIEHWDPAGSSYLWVRVPRIDGGSSKDFVWLYYDNPEARGEPQNPSGVWRDYKLVYHFSPHPLHDIFDSSPGNHHGEPLLSMPPLVPAQIGYGFPSSDSPKRYVHTHYREDLSSWTVEAWVWAAAAPQVTGSSPQASGPVMGNRGYNLGWDHDSAAFAGTVHCRDLVGYKAAGFGSLTGGRWYYLAGVYDSAVPVLRAFKDGTLEDQNTAIGSPLSAMAWDVFIGTSENANLVLDGIIDEVRVCGRTRSADWIHAQYLSMDDSFVTYGAVEEL